MPHPSLLPEGTQWDYRVSGGVPWKVEIVLTKSISSILASCCEHMYEDIKKFVEMLAYAWEQMKIDEHARKFICRAIWMTSQIKRLIWHTMWSFLIHIQIQIGNPDDSDVTPLLLSKGTKWDCRVLGGIPWKVDIVLTKSVRSILPSCYEHMHEHMRQIRGNVSICMRFNENIWTWWEIHLQSYLDDISDHEPILHTMQTGQ